MNRTLLTTSLALTAAGLALLLTPEKAEARAQGVDVSSFQGTVNWTAAHNNSSITWAYAKATEGEYYQDADYHNNMSNGKLAGLLMGAYHFARPDQNSGTDQANYFYNFANANFNVGGQTLAPMLDMEVWNGHVSASSYTAWANNWFDRILTRLHSDGRTSACMLYVSACNACNFNSGVEGKPWIANYNGENSETGTPWSSCASCSWNGTWRFWQWTASGGVSGISGNVDRDVYNGLFTDLASSDLVMSSYP